MFMNQTLYRPITTMFSWKTYELPKIEKVMKHLTLNKEDTER